MLNLYLEKVGRWLDRIQLFPEGGVLFLLGILGDLLLFFLVRFLFVFPLVLWDNMLFLDVLLHEIVRFLYDNFLSMLVFEKDSLSL